MSIELLRPQAVLSPQRALEASQQAPNILRQYSSWSAPWPLSLLLNSDTPEKWIVYENLFHTCLRTGDNATAQTCLKKMIERFGDSNDRVQGMVGMYNEATAKTDADLESILQEYEEAINGKPTNMIMRKRHAALLKSMSRLPEATTALTELLDISPIDAEAWSELAELYLVQGQYSQAIFSLEEVLLITPFAWNLHTRLGEVLYIAAQMDTSGNNSAATRLLSRSMKTFCRSIELCDNYLRGFYGLKLTTTVLQASLAKSSNVRDSADEDFPLPSLSIVQKLNELATSKLAEIVRRNSTGETGWDGFDEAEIIAARELLNRDTSTAPR